MTTEIAAGRELDVLIATEVMGWTDFITEGDYIVSDDGDVHWFSTTYEGMGLVLERMRELGWDLTLYHGSTGCEAEVYPSIGSGAALSSRTFTAEVATLPHAVCLAALKAVRA